MNSVSSCCCNSPDQITMLPGNWGYQSAQIAKAAIAGEQSANIEIQTADGDKITLSSDITFESSAVTYEELGRTSSSYKKSQGQMISASANSQLELSVEGTLDALEKKEIKEVLMNLFRMVKDFISGNADPEETHKFANLTTISEVKAEFDINADITIAAQSASNFVAQTPSEDKPALQEVQTANPPAVSERVDRLTDRMIQFVKDAGVEPSKVLKRMNRKLSRLSSKFVNAGPGYFHRMRLRQEILQNFAEKLKKLSPESEAGMNNMKLAGAEKAANLNEPTTVETTSSASETILEVARQEFHFEMEYSVNNDS